MSSSGPQGFTVAEVSQPNSHSLRGGHKVVPLFMYPSTNVSLGILVHLFFLLMSRPLLGINRVCFMFGMFLVNNKQYLPWSSLLSHYV